MESVPVPGLPGVVFEPLDPVADVLAGRQPVIARRSTVETNNAPKVPDPPEPIFTARSPRPPATETSPKQALLARLDAFEDAARTGDEEIDVAELVAVVRAVVERLS